MTSTPLPEQGDKTTEILAMFTHPENGYDLDKENAQRLLGGVYYDVEHVSMGQSHTNITLKGIKGSFNSVQFDFFDRWMEPIDIYSMPEFNHYLRMENTHGTK